MFSRLFGANAVGKGDQASVSPSGTPSHVVTLADRTTAASLPDDPSEILGQAQQLLRKLRATNEQEQSFALLNTTTRLGEA
jgi:hypothetical protein